MSKQKKKKKKLRVGRLLLLLIILGAISFVCIKYINIRILNVTISGNNILSDQEILEEAKIDDYPSFFSTFIIKVKNNLKLNPYIKEVKVSKGFLSIKIKVVEEKVLYVDSTSGDKVTLTSSFKDGKNLNVPILINEVPKDKLKSFKKAMNKIDENILSMISEIKYDPNEIDKDRYYVYMNDGNCVYLTVNKFKKINDYNKILENVGKQNGVLYLDYGDYFKQF